MPKVCKSAYGISEDGVSIKLALLNKEDGQIYLQALEQVEMDASLYRHGEDIKAIDETEAWAKDGKADTEIDLSELSQDDTSGYQLEAYEQLFKSYPLSQGVISVNVNEDNLVKLPVNNPLLSIKQQHKIVRENLPHKEFKAGNWQCSIITVQDQPELWLHSGHNKLLDILLKSEKELRHKYYFQFADTNDTALASLYSLTHPEESDATTLVLYLGLEYRKALHFTGNKLTHILPIQVTQQSPDIETLYSKLSLAMDEAHVTDPQRLLLCGDLGIEDNLIFLQNQLPNTKVGYWLLSNLELDPNARQKYNAGQIARAILPIALAWKSLQYDSPLIIHSNFLPAYIIEGQKVFKIAWHGYMVLGLLFVSSLYMTTSVLQSRLDLTQQKARNKILQLEFMKKKNEAEQVLAMAKAIDVQKANIETIKTLLTEKNPWTEVINTLNNSLQSHPSSWIKNIQKTEGGFQLVGATTKRSNIVVFSNLFPNGMIKKVSHHKIRNVSIWEFELSYRHPTVNWYEIMEQDMQKLRDYETKKADAMESSDKTQTSKSNKPTARDQKTEQPKKDNLQTIITKGKDKIKDTITPKTDLAKPISGKVPMEFPTPPKNALSDKSDPAVQSYERFYAAFMEKQSWLMIDIGVKFLNNYPRHELNPYVRWYLSYQNWLEKQYNRPLQWLEPLLTKPDKTHPYALLLAGVIYRDSGDPGRGEDTLRLILQDYATHPTAKTARILLGVKQ